MALRQAATLQRNVGLAHLACPQRNPFALRFDALLIVISLQARAALPALRVREPHHILTRVDTGARERAAVAIEKFDLSVTHAVCRAGLCAIDQVHIKRGVRCGMPVTVRVRRRKKRGSGDAADVPSLQWLPSMRTSLRSGVWPRLT